MRILLNTKPSLGRRNDPKSLIKCVVAHLIRDGKSYERLDCWRCSPNLQVLRHGICKWFKKGLSSQVGKNMNYDDLSRILSTHQDKREILRTVMAMSAEDLDSFLDIICEFVGDGRIRSGEGSSDSQALAREVFESLCNKNAHLDRLKKLAGHASCYVQYTAVRVIRKKFHDQDDAKTFLKTWFFSLLEDDTRATQFYNRTKACVQFLSGVFNAFANDATDLTQLSLFSNEVAKDVHSHILLMRKKKTEA